MNDRTPLAPVTGLKRTTSLPPPPARQAASTETLARPATPPRTTTRATTASTTAQTSAAATKKPRSAGADTIRPISLSLPLSLANALKSQARSSRRTHADVLMDAIVSKRDQLGDLIAQMRPHPTQDELFVRSTAAEPKEARVSLSMRMLSRNVAILDELVKEHGGDSRSQLCAAALASYLLA